MRSSTSSRWNYPAASLVCLMALQNACTGSVASSEDRPSGSGGEAGGSAGSDAVNGGNGAGGTGSKGGSGATTVNSPAFSCADVKPIKSPSWRRLTHVEYDNATRDLAVFALGDATLGDKAWTEAKQAWTSLPSEQRKSLPIDTHGSSRRLDQDVTQEHANAWYKGAVAIGQALTTSARIGKMMGSCATDADSGNDAKCLTDFIGKFAERVLRRPLEADDLAFYTAYYGSTAGVAAEGVADVIAGLLSSPYFLYEIVHGDKQAKYPGQYSLSAYDLASRLSFHFWATTPDDALWAAAKSGALLRVDEYEKQLTRLASDQRARPSLQEFYRDWLKVDDVKSVEPATFSAQFKSFAGADLPTTNLRDAVIADSIDMLSYYTWDQPSKFDEVLKSDLSFARSPDLAKLYGIGAWKGTGTPPSFPAGQRPGLLTRAAFLMSGSAVTRPIHKGAFIRQSVLCDIIPPPPPNAANVDTGSLAAKVLSTRQFVEAITQKEGTPCNNCHRPLINALGFATENFDALARVRTNERVLSDMGVERGMVPVDTSGVPHIYSEDERMIQGPSDLVRLLVESGRPTACMAQQYFRFSFGRQEDLEQDGCVLEKLRTTAEKTNIAGMFNEVARSPEFKQRVFQ
jgi:hypothetical protein